MGGDHVTRLVGSRDARGGGKRDHAEGRLVKRLRDDLVAKL